MTATLSAMAPAKINLMLHVTGKRPDGYHLLESIVVFTQLGDRVEVAPSPMLKLNVTGPYAEKLPTDPQENIIWKTALLLQQEYEISEGAEITLQKNLPVASGIGGGSSDAATAARLLCLLWNLPLGREELAELLLPLGSDIPACLAQRSLLFRGVGEEVTWVDTPPAWLVLCNPGTPVSTRAIFSGLSLPEDDETLPPMAAIDFLAMEELTRNDLTETACQYVPEIHDILRVMGEQKGCELARMSGSGATCFGIFPSESDASEAALNLRKRFPPYWVEKTKLLGK